MVNVAIDGCVVLLFLGLRKMVYDVDYSISAMSPSSVQNVAALDDAFYGGDAEDHSATAQSVDRHVGGIRGRKRGLLNFPLLGGGACAGDVVRSAHRVLVDGS